MNTVGGYAVKNVKSQEVYNTGTQGDEINGLGLDGSTVIADTENSALMRERYDDAVMEDYQNFTPQGKAWARNMLGRNYVEKNNT